MADHKLKISDIPCTPPDGFWEGPPLAENTNDKPTKPTIEPWPPSGHGQGAADAFRDSVWGVPGGRRK